MVDRTANEIGVSLVEHIDRKYDPCVKDFPSLYFIAACPNLQTIDLKRTK